MTLRRRDFLLGMGGTLATWAVPMVRDSQPEPERPPAAATVRLFLCGDVMTGRGIDQVLPHPVDPRLYEPWVRSALRYVEIAEAAHGKIARPVAFSYLWGEALEVWRREAPDLKLVNLETSVTTSDEPWPDKHIHYRMHPRNVPCLTVAGIDGCALANNHVVDWGRPGLLETLDTLRGAGVAWAGAGRNRAKAAAPAIFPLAGKGRVLFFSFGSVSSGVPAEWMAKEDRPGVALLPDLSRSTVEWIAGEVETGRQSGDRVVISLHWGPNWGYRIPAKRRSFARRLVEETGVDVVHGHSSHHPLGIEVHRGKAILYGCGDFLTDYEGIGGHEKYRPDLSLGYFLDLSAKTGELARMTLVPFQLRRFRLVRPAEDDVAWLRETLDRESRRLGARVEHGEQGVLRLGWG